MRLYITSLGVATECTERLYSELCTSMLYSNPSQSHSLGCGSADEKDGWDNLNMNSQAELKGLPSCWGITEGLTRTH
jgi:hypothetical protein